MGWTSIIYPRMTLVNVPYFEKDWPAVIQIRKMHQCLFWMTPQVSRLLKKKTNMTIYTFHLSCSWYQASFKCSTEINGCNRQGARLTSHPYSQLSELMILVSCNKICHTIIEIVLRASKHMIHVGNHCIKSQCEIAEGQTNDSHVTESIQLALKQIMWHVRKWLISS